MANRFSQTTRVQQDVLNLIATQNLGVGDRIPPERELAKLLGASVITVQRALADLVDQEIIERMQGKGSFLKRSPMVGAMMHSLAFILVNRSSVRYEGLLDETRTSARSRNHDLRVIAGGERPNDDVARQLSKVSGVILSGIVTDDWVEFLDLMHLPCVAVGHYSLKREVNLVWPDMRGGARMLVRALFDRGCRRIGLINGARTYRPSNDIYEGCCSELAELKLPFEESSRVWCRKERRLEDMGEFFARNRREFDALVVEIGCFQPLQIFLFERAMSLPRTVLGVLAGDLLCVEPLHRIQQVAFQSTLGECAVNLLFEHMSGRTKPRVVTIPPRLVSNPSTP